MLDKERGWAFIVLSSRIKQEQGFKTESDALRELMTRAESGPVMEELMGKSGMVDKYHTLYTMKKVSGEAEEYIAVLGLVAGCVGMDFVEGLYAQNEY
jgi:hypothetical protein